MASSDLLTLTVNPVIACREHRLTELGCVREDGKVQLGCTVRALQRLTSSAADTCSGRSLALAILSAHAAQCTPGRHFGFDFAHNKPGVTISNA